MYLDVGIQNNLIEHSGNKTQQYIVSITESMHSKNIKKLQKHCGQFWAYGINLGLLTTVFDLQIILHICTVNVCS